MKKKMMNTRHTGIRHQCHEGEFSSRIITRKLVVLCLLFLALFTSLAIFAGPLKDSDLWFQMAYGRYFLENHTLIPDHTIYSWTTTDNSQIYCAWITEIFLYLLYTAGGLQLLFVLRYLCLFVFITLFLVTSKRNSVFSQPVTWLILLIAILMSQSAIIIKPEIFSFVFISVLSWLWWTNKRSQTRWKRYYLIPLLFLVWTNAHGGFIFGAVFLGLLVMGEILNVMFSPQEALSPVARKHFFRAVSLCIVVVFLTPYGWKYPAQLIYNLILNSTFSQDARSVFAYKSIFSPNAIHFHFIDYFIGASIILLVLLWPKIRKSRLDWTFILTNIIFGIFYIKLLRATYFWAPIFSFSALYLLSTELSWWKQQKCLVSNFVNSIVVIACVFLAVRGDYEAICTHNFEFGMNYTSPVEEARYLKDNFSGLRLGNNYDSGSYLLWTLWPEMKVFIDSRYFPYRDWYSEYQDFRSGVNIQAFLRKYDCDVWCLTYDFPQLSYFIQSIDWSVVYLGPSCCIFVSKKGSLKEYAYTVSESVYTVNIYKAIEILYFTLSIGDIDTASKIVQAMKRDSLCTRQKDIIVKSHNELGVALAKRNRIDEAIFHFFYALLVMPDYEKAHYNLGNALFIQGRIDAAIEHYAEAVRLNPKDKTARKGLQTALEHKTSLEKDQ